MYSLLHVNPEVDKLINKSFYSDKLNGYWDPARKYVDEYYTSIPFPFDEISCPRFSMTYHWSLEELAGYINSWSAVHKYIREHSVNPVNELKEQLQSYWGNDVLKVSFPITLRMGRVFLRP